MRSKLTYSSPADPLLKKLFIRAIEEVTGRPALERKYQEILDANPAPIEVWKLLIEHLELSLVFDKKQLANVPQSGPVVYIANHPYGVVDGIMLGYLVSLLHPSFKFLVNEVLCRDELLNHFFLPIDFAPTKEAQKSNIQTKQIALENLAADIPVVVFPSGGVATSPNFFKKAEELEWKRFVVKLIKMSKATVVPIFFPGQNSRLFQIVSNISMDLRLGLLLHEVRNKIGRTISIEIGDPIPYYSLDGLKTDAMLQELQETVAALGTRAVTA